MSRGGDPSPRFVRGDICAEQENRRMSPRFILSIPVFAAVLLALLAWPGESRASEQQEQVDKAVEVVNRFARDPEMEWIRNHAQKAHGIMIVPTMVKGGFILGGSGGTGVMLSKNTQDGTWSYPAFYAMGSVTLGLQIGGEVSEIIILFMTEKGRDAMLTREFKLGGDVSVAAGPIGGGAKAQTADAYAFSRTKGVYGGLNIEGAVIEIRDEWNESYYGEPVSPATIFVKRGVSNPNADSLRASVANLKPE
jgi:lipid-binding SYLF domain-containing protein